MPARASSAVATMSGKKKSQKSRSKALNPDLFKVFEPLGLGQLRHANTFRGERKEAHDDAVHFFERKLAKEPDMPRYNQCLAALRTIEGDFASSEKHYKRSLAVNPSDVMLRNDFSLQLAREGRMDQAVDEMGKALVVNPEHYLLRKNMAALLARKGDYSGAVGHAERAAQVNPDDGMVHRNLAAIYNARGDGRAALEHSLKSIEVETGSHSQVSKPNSKAFRSAAVQTIAHNGSHQDAVDLMTQARKLEGRRVKLDTSVRTYEIISSIMKRQGNLLDDLKSEERVAQEREIKKQQFLESLLSAKAKAKK